MKQLEAEVQACPELMLNNAGLQALKIKGVGFAELFASFGDVDTFCDCREPLPYAWSLKDNAQMLIVQDPNGAYTSLAAVNNICGPTLQPLILNVAGRPSGESCNFPLASQAGFTTPADRHKLKKVNQLMEDHCRNYSAADWMCATQKSQMADFKDCITAQDNKIGNKASCGKLDCVMDKLDCGAEAKAMYISAVNLEMNKEIVSMSMSKDCEDNSASGIQISLLTIAAGLILMFS